MLAKRHLVAPFLRGGGFGGEDHGCVLAVSGYQQISGGKNTFKSSLVIYQHVASARTHKNFHATGQTRVDTLYGLEVIVGCA